MGSAVAAVGFRSVAEPVRFLISFGFSRSGRFDEAVRQASALPGYRLLGEAHTVDATVAMAEPLFAPVLDLALSVASWRAAYVDIDGRPGRLNSIAEVARCHAARESSGRGDGFCRSTDRTPDLEWHFGCRRLTVCTPRSFRHAPVSDVLAKVLAQAEDDAARKCPAFDLARVRSDVDRIASAGLWRDPDWPPLAGVAGRVLQRVRTDAIAQALAEHIAANGLPAPTIKVATAPPFSPNSHALVDGRCRACGKPSERFHEPCGRPDLGRVGMLELE